MQRALAELGSGPGAAEDNASSSSSCCDTDEATADETPVVGPAWEPAKQGKAAVAAAQAAEKLQGALVETGCERQVRLGIIMPFQNLLGLARLN
eukprot:jgi/Ulvmu1/1083/UM105_0042.1